MPEPQTATVRRGDAAAAAAAARPATGGELTWWFERHPASVRCARRMLRYFLQIWGVEHYRDAAELIVSELVTNAVQHVGTSAGPEIRTRFLLGPEGLRIEVTDTDSDRLPRRREPGESDDSGRGLALLDALTTAWGCEPGPCGAGKTVWATLGADDGTPGTVTLAGC